MSRRFSSNATVREEIRLLERLGFEFAGYDSRKHPQFEHPKHGHVSVAGSPGGNQRRWKVKHRERVARLMGLNLFEFERLIAGQDPKAPVKDKPRSDRRRRQRPRPVSLLVAEHESDAADPVGVDRLAGPLAWRRYRCVVCAYPWMSQGVRLDDECPKCGSSDLKERAA